MSANIAQGGTMILNRNEPGYWYTVTVCKGEQWLCYIVQAENYAEAGHKTKLEAAGGDETAWRYWRVMECCLLNAHQIKRLGLRRTA